MVTFRRGTAMLLLIAATAPTPTTAAFSFMEFLMKIMSKGGNSPMNAIFSKHPYTGKPQPMLVIGAGYGRTGTSSFTMAMMRLGIKTYHMGPGVGQTPGHMELWYEHARQQLAGEPGIMNEIIDSVASHGFNATQDYPGSLAYKEFMERYPQAKVVLTVRSDGDGQAWATSMLSSILLLDKAIKSAPFCWIPKIKKFATIMEWIKVTIYAPDDPITGTPRRDDLAASYENWVEEVKAAVPADKLLVFAAKEGWKPLCDFLSPLDPKVESRCNDIMNSGEPYPRMNEKAQVQRMHQVLRSITYFTYCLPLAALAAAGVLLKRRTEKAAGDSGKHQQRLKCT